MTFDAKTHWESVYQRKGADGVSWFRPHLDQSVAFVEAARLPHDAAIIDVGGGASTFVDDLLDRGYTDLTVLDLSAAALDAARRRLGDRAARVHWLVADITQVALQPGHYAFWNDRAVFHFLTTPEQRQRYVAMARASLAPGGHIVVGTFGSDGPEKCSGLEVKRYSADGLYAEFGTPFTKVGSVVETHVTPWGTEQQFVYCHCLLQGSATSPNS